MRTSPHWTALAISLLTGCATFPAGSIHLQGMRAERTDPLRFVMAATYSGNIDLNEAVNEVCRDAATIPEDLNLGALAMRCSLVGEDGKPGAPVYDGYAWRKETLCEGPWEAIKAGPQRISITARCQPPKTIDVNVVARDFTSENATKYGLKAWDDGLHWITPVDLHVPLPPPERRYLRPGVKVKAFAVREPRVYSPPPSPAHFLARTDVELPPNTQVEIVRTMPDRSGNCSRAFFKVVDAGGATVDAEVLLGNVADLSPTPFDGLSAKDFVERERTREREDTARRQEDERRRAEAVEKIIAGEVETGRCSQEHFDQMQAALGRVMFLFDHAGNSDGFKLLASDPLIAKPDGGREAIEFKGRGELHFFTIADGPVTMEVKNPEGYRMSGGSVWERLVATTGMHTASVTFQGNPGTYGVTVKGKGCALVMVFLKYL